MKKEDKKYLDEIEELIETIYKEINWWRDEKNKKQVKKLLKIFKAWKKRREEKPWKLNTNTFTLSQFQGWMRIIGFVKIKKAKEFLA